MKKIYSKFFFIIYLIFSFGLIFINFIKPKNYHLLGLLMALLAIATIVVLKNKHKLVINRRVFIILILLSLILRLSFLSNSYINIVSDYAFNFESCVSFAKNISLNKIYISAFPHLYSYILLLGSVMKVIGTNYNSVIILNIIVELIGILFLYKFLKNNYSKNTSMLLILFYLYNPFSFLWIVKCVPVIITNTLLIIFIYFFDKLDNEKYILNASLTGLFLGIANTFRPIMMVAIIALLIYLIYTFLNKKDMKKTIIGFGLVCICYILVNNIFIYIVEKKLDTQTAFKPGFSILVGSNYDSHGMWNESDSEIFANLLETRDGITSHDIAMHLGIDRYKNNGTKSLILFAYKAAILGRNVNNYVYGDTINSFKEINDFIKQFGKYYLSMFYWLILIINMLIAIKILNCEIDKIKILNILALGFYSSLLFVEVSPRYFLPVIVPMIMTFGILEKDQY